MTNTTGTEPFRFTDADGDYLHIGIPTSPTTGHPAISFCTLAEPVHVPVEQIEGLITALRRLVAAQSAVSPAAVEPPADQTTPSLRAGLREHLAAAIHADLLSTAYRRDQGLLGIVPRLADAVLAVLYREWPWLRAEAEDAAPTDRAAVLREAAQRLYTALFPAVYADLGQKAAEGVNRAVSELRRMADETATETHACDNCEGVDPDTCFNNPTRPPEQCPRSEFEDYGQQCQKPAGHNLCSFEEQPAAGARQDGAPADDPLCICTHRRSRHLKISGRLLCDECDPDSTDNLVCKEFDAL